MCYCEKINVPFSLTFEKLYLKFIFNLNKSLYICSVNFT